MTYDDNDPVAVANAIRCGRESIESQFADAFESEVPTSDKPANAFKPFRLEAIKAAELVAKNWDQHYLIDGMLTEHEVCILAGAKKALKTNSLCDMAVSLATASRFLNRFGVPSSRMVGFISGESGGATLKETLTRISHSKGIELGDIDNFVLSMKMPQIDAPAHMKELRRWLTEHAVDVLLLDPAYLCMDGADSGNLMVQGAKLRRVAEVCADCRATLVLAHHTKRHTGRESYDVPELEDIAWAGFQEFARQWLLIGRRERYTPGTGSHKLWLNYGGSAGHSGLWGLDIEEGIPSDEGGRRWEVDIMTSTEALEESRRDKDKAKIQRAEDREVECRRRLLEALKIGPPDTGKQLRELAGISAPEFSKAIVCLIKDGLAEKCEVTKANNQTYEGYQSTGNTGKSTGN